MTSKLVYWSVRQKLNRVSSVQLRRCAWAFNIVYRVDELIQH